MILVDRFTGFVKAYAMAQPTARRVAEKMFEYICDFGTPVSYKLDNGSEFKGEVDKLLKEFMGSKVSKIAPMNPKANAKVERWHERKRGRGREEERKRRREEERKGGREEEREEEEERDVEVDDEGIHKRASHQLGRVTSDVTIRDQHSSQQYHKILTTFSIFRQTTSSTNRATTSRTNDEYGERGRFHQGVNTHGVGL